MKTVSPGVLKASLALGLALTFIAPSLAYGQSLAGETLELSRDFDALAGSLLGSLFGGRKVEGEIKRVRVENDSPSALSLAVEYQRGDGLTLVAELLGDEQRRLSGYGDVRVVLDAGDGTAAVGISLQPGVEAFESRFLRLTLSRKTNSNLGKMFVFELKKSWGGGTVDGAGVAQPLEVALVPVGKASTLRKDQTRLEAVNLPKVMYPARIAPATAQPPTATSIKMIAARPLAMEASPRRVVTPMATVSARHTPTVTLSREKTALVTKAFQRQTMVKTFTYGIKKEDKNRGARGPGGQRINLLEGLRSDVDIPFDEILTINREVYEDANPASGIYYFLPHSYHLQWDEFDGHGMRMLYGASADASVAGEVIMATRLDSGITTSEASLARALLDAHRARHGASRANELRTLPLDAPPAVSLSGGLAHQYDIEADRIIVNAVSDVLGEMDVSWVTDSVTKENLQLALTEDIGINGVVSLDPTSDVLGNIGLPIQIRLADRGTFGRISWLRETWQNRLPYPVRLKYVHALMIHGNQPVIYSWSTGSAEVAPGGKVNWEASKLPQWVARDAKRLWIDYSIARECAPCDRQVLDRITSGVTAAAPSDLIFRTLNPLADSGAVEISVRVRSRYFHPKNRELQTKPALVLREDMAEYTMGPIYLADRQPGEVVPDDPLFEYQLELILEDGRPLTSSTWTEVHDLRAIIGTYQVEQQLGPLNSGGNDE